MNWAKKVKYLRRAGLYDTVTDQLDTIISESPQDFLLFSEIGLCLSRSGRKQEALRYYDLSVNIKPHAKTYNRRGLLLVEMQRYFEAINSYKKAILLNPDYKDAYNNLGIVLDEIGEYDEAIASYMKAIKIEPEFKEALNNFGVTLDKKTDFSGALEKYNKAISIDSGYYIAYVNSGISYRKLGDLEKARAAYEEALRLNPDNQTTKQNLSILIELLERSED